MPDVDLAAWTTVPAGWLPNQSRRVIEVWSLRRLLPAALFLLPACGLQTEPVASNVEIPHRFREADPSKANWPSPDWWRGFGSPELDRLMARLVAGNFDLAQASARIRQADAQMRVTGSTLLPAIDSSATSSRQRTGTAGRPYLVNSHSLTGSVSYELDFWGKNRASLEAARQNVHYARYDAEVVRLTQIASLATAYFEVLEAEAELRMQRQNLQAARRILGIVRAKVAGGTATGLELAQQETTVANEEAKLPPIEQTAAQGRNSIAVLLGETPQTVTITGGGFDALAIPRPSPGQPADLIARRPDVARAEANLGAYYANVTAARAALLPSINLSGEAGWTATALGVLFSPASQVWSLAASLTQTIFDGGKLRGQVALRRAEAEEQLYAYRAAIMAALKEVENGIIALRQAEEQERRLRVAVERAERAYAISEAQLQAGTANLTTVLNTQQSLFSARISLVQARLSTLRAAVDLFKVLGGGWH